MNDYKVLEDFGIILEGADQSGKTTLAKAIAAITGKAIIHYNPPDNVIDFHEEYTSFLRLGLAQQPIVDRGYFSEMIYGPIFRGVSGVTQEIQATIEQELGAHNYILVLCHRENFGDHNFEPRNEKYSFEDIMTVRESFMQNYACIGIPKTLVDPFDYQNTVDSIANFCCALKMRG